MLVLARKYGESITVTGPCVIKVLNIHQGRVQIGIEADDSVKIIRNELRYKPPKGGGHRNVTGQDTDIET